MSDTIITIKDVVDNLKVNKRTIYRLAASGELPGLMWVTLADLSRASWNNSSLTRTIALVKQ